MSAEERLRTFIQEHFSPMYNSKEKRSMLWGEEDCMCPLCDLDRVIQETRAACTIETVHIIIHNRSYPVEAYLDEGGAYKRYAELQKELPEYGVVSLEIKEKKEIK